MPTFQNPTVDADEAQAALHALAYATRTIDDPREIYSVLGSLTTGLASLSQSLDQLGAAHDTPAHRASWAVDDSRHERAAQYRVSWELHRAAEMLRQVREVIANAHNAESTITYVPRDVPASPGASRRLEGPGISL